MGDQGTVRSLLDWVELALTNPTEKRKLLQQPPLLRQILNDIPARQRLFERAVLTEDLTQRRAVLALIVDVMKGSRGIWRGGSISGQVYNEALAKTWVWFIDWLPNYQPEKASFVTRFNTELKWKIRNEPLPLPALTDNMIGNMIGNALLPDPYAWDNLLEEWIALVKTDQALMNCRMQRNLRLNCQGLLLDILTGLQTQGVFTWEAIAARHNVEPDVLKRFCKRRCFARFKALTSE